MFVYLLQLVFSKRCLFHNWITLLMGAAFLGVLSALAYHYPAIAITVVVVATLFSIPKRKVTS